MWISAAKRGCREGFVSVLEVFQLLSFLLNCKVKRNFQYFFETRVAYRLVGDVG